MNDVRAFLRPGRVVGHLLVLLAVLVCLRLAWWQLERSEQTDGTFQNLGYALLWPAFGVAFIYMWVQFIRLEAQREAEDERAHQEALVTVLSEAESLTAGAAPVEDRTAGDGTMVEVASPAGDADFVGVVGDEGTDDAELIAYNRALAALAQQDHRDR